MPVEKPIGEVRSLFFCKAIFDVAGKENVDHVVIHYSIGNALIFTMKGSATLDQELLDRVKSADAGNW